MTSYKETNVTKSQKERSVVIVGAGFAGFNAARELSRLVGASTEIVVINSADYFLYLPLMPQVAGGLVEPRHICVSLSGRLRQVRFVLGDVHHVDPVRKAVSWAGPEGASGQVSYDRLILTVGSVNKLLPIPGVADYAHGFRSIAEAIYLRDHITRQLELAAVASDGAERAARCTFVVVGAGYTGTEVVAQGELLTARLARRMPGLAGQQIRWLLLDTAPRLLPDLDEHLSRTAERVLRRRGVELRTGQSVAEAVDGSVKLSTGENVPTCSLIWCVGVRPDPLVDGLDLATNRGRLAVDEFMSVPGAADIYACGDCAAVPDLTRPGQVCGMTAQHAQRQGKQVARNVAASLGTGKRGTVQAPRRGLPGGSGRAGRRRQPAACPGFRAGRQCPHPRLSPDRHVREPDPDPGRLGAERGHPHRTDIVRGDQRRVRALGRGQTTSLTPPNQCPQSTSALRTCSACGAWSHYGVAELLPIKPDGRQSISRGLMELGRRRAHPGDPPAPAGVRLLRPGRRAAGAGRGAACFYRRFSLTCSGVLAPPPRTPVRRSVSSRSASSPVWGC